VSEHKDYIDIISSITGLLDNGEFIMELWY